MPIASRHFHLKFLQGSYLSDDAEYGSALYGDSTYGAQATQSVLGGDTYELLPFPGWHPQDPAWVYRIGDTTRFEALVVASNDPTDQVDVSTLTAAHLILTQWTMDGSKAWKRGFELLPDSANNVLYRDLLPTDLIVAGRFRVSIRLLFDSGRYMTVEGNDGVLMQVNDATFDPLPLAPGEGILE